MKPRPRQEEQDALLRPRLSDMIDMRHELARLAALIDWEFFEREWAGFFPSGTGRPATSPRLVAGLLYLQHAFRLSDEAVVARWVETPYDQHFTAETFLQHRPPIDPSSLTRWRARIGEEGAEWLLTKTIEAGRASGAVDDDSLSRVTVDTTVMEKNIAHPTDARLYDKARQQLVSLAGEAGITLRQNDNRLAPRLAMQAGRYAHARQFRRMRKALKKLKAYTGHVLRDLRRQLDAIPGGPLRERVLDSLVLAGRLLHQGPRSRGKIYALHEPEVDCISKGKARKRYEFGTKVSLATTIDEGFVTGHARHAGQPLRRPHPARSAGAGRHPHRSGPAPAVVDRGYRGHGVTHTRVLISGTRRGLTPTLKRLLRRRSAIEPEIGHMKTDGRFARCPLKGTTGDTIFAVLCGCGHNIRKSLAHSRAFGAVFLVALCAAILPIIRPPYGRLGNGMRCSA